jgi:hypothetical protein
MIFTSTRRMLSDSKLRLRARILTPLLRSTSVSIPALIILVLDVTGASRMHALTGSFANSALHDRGCSRYLKPPTSRSDLAM